MCDIKTYIQSSIGKKKVVAATGLALILFVIGHLAGNLIFYLGPDAFNAYAKKLAGLRPALYVIEIGLLIVFLLHMWFITLVVHDNIRARPVGYQVNKPAGKRSFATSSMSLTGIIIVAFVIWHLIDFTFVDKKGPLSYIGEQSYGLYGIVYNAFKNPLHSMLYIIAMCAVGLHLSHGLQSFCQTFGLTGEESLPLIKKISGIAGIMVALLFSSIPLYVLLMLPGY